MKDDHSFGCSKGGCAFTWACQGLGILPSLTRLGLRTLPSSIATGSGTTFLGLGLLSSSITMGLATTRSNVPKAWQIVKPNRIWVWQRAQGLARYHTPAQLGLAHCQA